ncbi:hypothetical protein CFP56_034918 [Quercus suber]|uniref:DBC1/CARP1 catalytically inactive NUDIX hydrolase domain-containing protein n=1 Tax=Quercus suber TaxID=58331 RepID=A0AAW0JBL3_QUESU
MSLNLICRTAVIGIVFLRYTDRLGKDGLFSHKEVTVLFVPDFSECLPSLDAWRDQWAMACSQEGCCREGAPTFFEKREIPDQQDKSVATTKTFRQAADAENLVSEVKRSEKKTVPKTDSKTVATKKQGDGNSSKTEIKADKDDKDDERKTGEKSGMVPKVETDADKKKVPQNDGKKGKLKAGDKSKDEKLRLLSHSPDSFLDYTDKDIQESTFETSDLPVKEQDNKSETLNTAQPDEDKTKVHEEDKTVDHVDEVKI